MLIDILPNSVEIEGEEYDINSNFRTSILFELMVQDDELSEVDKLVNTLNLFYPIIPPNTEKALEEILWFYRCGKDLNVKGKGSGSSTTQIYSYDYDDEYIYSAFLSQYNIDLQDIEDLHWWKFKAMFKSLKEDNEIVKIMGYRSMKVDNKMTRDEKSFYNKMKEIHKIPQSKNEAEKINAIEEALLKGEDISKLL